MEELGCSTRRLIVWIAPPLRESSKLRKSESESLLSSEIQTSSHTAFHFNGSRNAFAKMSADIHRMCALQMSHGRVLTG